MMQGAQERQPGSFLFLAMALWGALLLFTLGAFVHSAIGTIQKETERAYLDVSAEINARLATNVAILVGFAHMVSDTPIEQRERLLRYAYQAIERFPHIYALEIITPVRQADLAAFVAKQRSNWNPQFEARRFNYDAPELGWSPLEDKPLYYLLTFIAPETPEVRAIYGLDVTGDPVFATVLDDARRSPGIPASLAFKLAENGEQAIGLFLQNENFPVHSPESLGMVVEMVIKLADLLPELIDPHLSYELQPLMVGTAGSEPLRVPSLPSDSMLPVVYEHRIEHQLRKGNQHFALVVTRPIYVEELINFFWLPTLLIAVSFVALLFKLQSRREARERMRQEKFSELENIALYDPLTGLPNRRLLIDRIEQAIERARRTNGIFAIVFVDLDGFKGVNDFYGHLIGDELLRRVAERMRANLRASDTVARYGGDEFVVLMPDLSADDKAEELARSLRSWLLAVYQIDGKLELSVGASIGVALYPDDAKSVSELLNLADGAMYRDKRDVDSRVEQVEITQ